MRILVYIICLLTVLSGCKKNEELMTGPISGKILTFDQYCFPTSDQPDILVKLFQDTILMGTISTNSNGQYLFENMPYGKYSINVEKAGFVQARYVNTVYHAGGYSPTLSDLYMYEVPTYQLNLDSIRKIQDYVVIFLKFNGDTLLPENACGMPLRVFASGNPDVSKDNFIASGKAYLSDYAINDSYNKATVHAQYQEWEMDESFDQLKNNIIYMRIYPIATGQGYGIYEYNPESLGLPSDVIGFLWDDVVSKK
jgi:hypothetical protein